MNISLPMAALLGVVLGLSIDGIIILIFCFRDHMTIWEVIKLAYGL